MRCLALYNTTEADDAVKIFILGHPLSGEGDLKGSGYMPDNYVVIGDAVTQKCFQGSVEKGMGDLTVPVGNDDTEPHA
jgi:hypothetical protein